MKATRFYIPLVVALVVLADVAAAPEDDRTAVEEAAVYSDEPFLALVRKYAIDGGETVTCSGTRSLG